MTEVEVANVGRKHNHLYKISMKSMTHASSLIRLENILIDIQIAKKRRNLEARFKSGAKFLYQTKTTTSMHQYYIPNKYLFLQTIN